jgi:ribosomal protein S3
MIDGSSKLRVLEATLEAMLEADIDITAREVVRRSDGVFKHASDITRQLDRRTVFESFEARQKALRDLMSRADKTSRANLSARLAALEERVREVRA